MTVVTVQKGGPVVKRYGELGVSAVTLRISGLYSPVGMARGQSPFNHHETLLGTGNILKQGTGYIMRYLVRLRPTSPCGNETEPPQAS